MIAVGTTGVIVTLGLIVAFLVMLAIARQR